MKSTIFTCVMLLVLSLAAAEPALSQSRSNRAGALNLNELLGLWPTHRPSGPQIGSAKLDAVALGLAKAKVYKFATADYPGAARSLAFDKNAGTIVGFFQVDPNNSPAIAFTLKGGVYRTLNVPGSFESILTGINSLGQMVGIYTDGTHEHGFLDVGGTFTNVDFPSAMLTAARDLNDTGQIVGSYTDISSIGHGFVDNGGVFTSIDFPTALATGALGINAVGDIVGFWQDPLSSGRGFLLSGGVFTSIDFPLALSTAAFGINDAGEIAGSYFDGSATHGFIYSQGAFSRVDVVGASDTALLRIKNDGQVTGTFIDALGENHALTAR